MLVRPFLALLVTLLPPGHGLGDSASDIEGARSRGDGEAPSQARNGKKGRE